MTPTVFAFPPAAEAQIVSAKFSPQAMPMDTNRILLTAQAVSAIRRALATSGL